MTENTKGYVVHNVFFWLKNPDSTEDRDQMVAGLAALKDIEGMRDLHVGIPLDSPKADHIEAGYSVGAAMVFENVEALRAYSPHQTHAKFIAECGHLWDRVLIIDTIDVV
jgi:hypothetical protein